MQVIVCPSCGIRGCEPGGWVRFRLAEEHVIWMPLIEELLDGEIDNFSPPYFFKKEGIPFLELSDYVRFQEQFPRFPSLKRMSPLTMAEAVRCVQHDAIDQLLGDLTQGPGATPELASILASSEGDSLQWCNVLSSAFETDCRELRTAVFSPPAQKDRLLTLFPDRADYPDWHVFWLGEEPDYYIAPDLKLLTPSTEGLSGGGVLGDAC